MDSLLTRLSQDEEFESEVRNNPEQNVWWAFQHKFNSELQGMIEQNFDFYKKLNDNPEIKKSFMEQMFRVLYIKMASKINHGKPFRYIKNKR